MEILPQLSFPILILYGDLDNAQTHHAPIVADLIEKNEWQHLMLVVQFGFGHQPGRKASDRIGSISDVNFSIVGNWLNNVSGN